MSYRFKISFLRASGRLQKFLQRKVRCAAAALACAAGFLAAAGCTSNGGEGGKDGFIGNHGEGGNYDLCVYGGNAAGVTAARAAALEGLSVVVVEPTIRLGGMTAGGLGYTDIGNKQVVMGLA